MRTMARYPHPVSPRIHDADRPLNDRQRLFVAEYVKDCNGGRAARDAGYTARSAVVTACKLLKEPHVAKAVGIAVGQTLAKVTITSEAVLERVRLIAFANLADCFDAQGQLLPLHTLPRDVSATIASL